MPQRLDIPSPESEIRPIPRGSNLPALRARRARVNRVGWIALALCVVLLVGGGFGARSAIVDLWPPAGRLYEVLGFAVEPESLGLNLIDVRSTSAIEDDVIVLTIEGQVVNSSGDIRAVPLIRISLANANGTELGVWAVPAIKSKLLPGETARFSTQLKAPPEGAESLSVSFVVEE
jgi:hypothetical protein